MSAHHLRHDKTCLNCGATVEERFCSRCGQENTEPKESFGHLVSHFFEDITHFDSKFFTTGKDLIFRPGFLTREYGAGRRTRYLNPIRMYVFISAIFFLALYAGKEGGAGHADTDSYAVNLFRQQLADSLRGAKGGGTGEGGRAAGGVRTTKTGGAVLGDTTKTGVPGLRTDSIRRVVNQELASRLDTAEPSGGNKESASLSFTGEGTVVIDLVEKKYHNLREFDSIQPTLPDSDRATGILGWILRNNVRLKEKHGYRSHIRLETNIQHTIPKLMFVLLPLFALLVSWFHDRKKYYYSQHAIFSVHFHCFYFLLFLAVLGLEKVMPWDWVSIALPAGALLWVFGYLVAALKNAYGQSVWLSLVKGMGIVVLYIISIIVAFWVVGLVAFLSA